MKNSIVKGNKAQDGSLAFYLNHNYSGVATKVLIDNCDIYDNRNTQYGYGVGVYCAGRFTNEYSIDIRNSNIRNNTTSSINSYGGGLCVYGSENKRVAGGAEEFTIFAPGGSTVNITTSGSDGYSYTYQASSEVSICTETE